MNRADIFDSACLSDTGRVRSHNEDAALARPDLGLWVVADGMGGHAAGDFASATIVEAAASVGLASSLDDLEARFLERLSRAHGDVRVRADELGATVGATVVALLTHGPDFACAWAGDSRLYRLRDGILEQLSRDHTEVEALLSQGTISRAEAAAWPRRNVITRAVGVGDQITCEMVRGNLQPGDVFLLCSDGLTEHVSDRGIAFHLKDAPDAETMCRVLVEDTLARGATDNVTCVAIRVQAMAMAE
ncbi:MAG: PP2C family serine/threonine-protein phosphatase [Pseudomonadota bacterium]